MLKTSKDGLRLPGFSPTAALAQSVQVEGSRWERSNECKDAGHDPHYRYFASGRAKNRHSCSQRVKQHQINVTFLSLSQIFVPSLEDANKQTHTALNVVLYYYFFFINNTSLFHILLCTVLQIVSRQTRGC